MIITFNITRTGWMADISRRKFNACLREAFRAIGVYWWKHFRSKHFTARGAAEYDYQPRKGEGGNVDEKDFRRSYTGRKLRRFGHTRPLVWTGKSERDSRTARIVATAKRVRVKMTLPRLNWRHESRRQTMREELTTISAKEETKLRKLFRDVLVIGLYRIRGRKRRKAA